MNIALNGKMASGKSTTLKELAKFLSYKGVSIGNEIKPLAALLIEDRQQFEIKIKKVIPNQEERERSIKEIYAYFDLNFQNAKWEKDENGTFIKNPPYRKLLQDFPMLVRKHFGEEVFAKIMLNGLEDCEKETILICDDLRLPNEKQLFEDHEFVVIRLDIDAEEQKKRLIHTYGSYNEEALYHRTEVALDDAIFDLRIDVTGKPVAAVVQEIIDFLNRVEAK